MYQDRGPLGGRKCYEVYQNRRSPCPFCPTLKTLSTGESQTQVVPYPSEEKPSGWLELSTFPIKDDQGNVRNVIEYVKDITEQRRLEQQLRQVEKMEAIGQLAGGIAHDFNNQLAGIVGFADLLRREVAGDPNLAELADDILKGAKRATELTSQLLAFARKGKYRVIPVDIHALIGEVVALLSRSIDKRITIQQQLDARASIVDGDPSQLQNTLLNLGLNARDAMPEGGELTLATETVDLDTDYCRRNMFEIRPGTYLRICVTDTGMGMDPETVNHVFEPFFTTKESGKGTGMGLAAVYGTIRNHHGAVNVYTEQGHGSTFSVYLPLSDTADPVDGERRDQEQEPVKGTGHILLVDDEEVVLDSGARMLRRLGYTVATCGNGADAVKLYRGTWENVDAVILDMVMPVMGGKETFSEMKKINPGVQVLLSTGYSLNGEAQVIVDMGAKGFIQKPFRTAELSHKLANITNGDTG
jgi:signal transduction histidine kinase/ActR/RegA family two-component response regulator